MHKTNGAKCFCPQRNAGITLIALVVTIIVLIILAAVSLSMLLGQNGIISKASEAGKETSKGNVEEEFKLLLNDYAIEKYTSEGSLTLVSYLESKGCEIISGEEEGAIELVVSYKGYEFAIDKQTGKVEGKIAQTIESTGVLVKQYTQLLEDGRKITVPKGFKVAKVKEDKSLEVITDKEELISFLGGKTTIDGKEVYNIDEGIVVIAPDDSEFVWVPVATPVIVVKKEEVEGSTELEQRSKIVNLVGAQMDLGKYPMAMQIEGETDYKSILYEPSYSNNPEEITPVITIQKSLYMEEPAGVDDSSKGDKSALGQTAIKRILGITDTEDVEEVYGQWTAHLQTEYNQMIKEVSFKGGFYVGRYETSSNDSTSSNRGTSTTMQSKGGKSTTIFNWYSTYEYQMNYSKTIEVEGNMVLKSAMIYGCQWDQIMLWMKNIKNTTTGYTDKYYTRDSTGMGNHKGSGVGQDIWSGIAATGCVDVKNIYDLAGNRAEWSQEFFYTGRGRRRRRL